MPKNKLVVSQKDNLTRLRNAVIAGVKSNVASLRAANVDFYGYAGNLPDYFTVIDPDFMWVSYSGESDIADDKKQSLLYRYIVDEWSNSSSEGLDPIRKELKLFLPHFEAIQRNDDDDTRIALIHAIFEAILDAFKALRKDGTFDGVPYLVLWLSDSRHDIINRSVKELNSAKVYKEYASEFIMDESPWWKFW